MIYKQMWCLTFSDLWDTLGKVTKLQGEHFFLVLNVAADNKRVNQA